MKNEEAKTRPVENPYEVWGNSELLPGWTWYVLKKWQIDDDKPNARWFCNVVTPICPDGEMGDVYVSDIKVDAAAHRLCKGCHDNLNPEEVRNALSRYGHGYVCSDCGVREAFEQDFISKQIIPWG